MAIKFLHTPKNKQFNFKPRYYNQEKEELENRIKKIKQEMGVNDEGETGSSYIPSIKGQMRGHYRKSMEQKRRSSIRLIIILIVLIALVYYLLYF